MKVKNIVLALTLAALGLVVNSTSTQTLASSTESYMLSKASTSSSAKLYTQSMKAGYAAFKKKDYKTALTNFKKALSLRPGDKYATQGIRNVQKYVVATPKRSSRKTSQGSGRQTSGLARKLVEKYIDSITNKGYSGTYYWCSQHEQFKSSFFAPKSARILDVSEYGKGASATIQLESTNQGGIPIRGNWKILMEKERKPERAKDFPGGWCIVLISKNN